MEEYEKKVLEFHQVMELPYSEPLNIELLKNRQKMMIEEFAELNAEIDNIISELEKTNTTKTDSRAKLLKEFADLQYVLSGTSVSFGLNTYEAFNRVHKSNMSKLIDGKPLKTNIGKIIKGPDYKPPYLDDIA